MNKLSRFLGSAALVAGLTVGGSALTAGAAFAHDDSKDHRGSYKDHDHKANGWHQDYKGGPWHKDHDHKANGWHQDYKGGPWHKDHDHKGNGWHKHDGYGWHQHDRSGWHKDHDGKYHYITIIVKY